MDYRCIIGLLIIYAAALFCLWRQNMFRTRACFSICVLLLFLALLIRGLCLNYETLDYQDFLTRWVAYFRDNGGWKALSQNVGNYNIPYLYFLAAFSYSGVKDLYLIKLLSIAFDVILAFGVLRLVTVYTDNMAKRLCAFFITLFLPTVILNGALWGQCDSI